MTKLSTVNINIGCFEKGTRKYTLYILVVKSNRQFQLPMLLSHFG